MSHSSRSAPQGLQHAYDWLASRPARQSYIYIHRSNRFFHSYGALSLAALLQGGPQAPHPAMYPHQSHPLAAGMDPNAVGPPHGVRFPDAEPSTAHVAASPRSDRVELQRQQLQQQQPAVSSLRGVAGAAKRTSSDSGSIAGSFARGRACSSRGGGSEHHDVHVPDVVLEGEGGGEGEGTTASPPSSRAPSDRASDPGTVPPPVRSSSSRPHVSRQKADSHSADRHVQGRSTSSQHTQARP